MSTVDYDANRQQLCVHFRDLSLYTYFDVPPEILEGLLRAPSAGKYFNARIRGQFAHERGTPDQST